jgi:hypothetical protein
MKLARWFMAVHGMHKWDMTSILPVAERDDCQGISKAHTRHTALFLNARDEMRVPGPGEQPRRHIANP